MSILIKGMEMPTNCCECFAFKSNANDYLFCRAKRIAFGKEDAEWLPLKTPNWCPLVPVPEHGDLIDRDKLEKDIDNYIGGEESRSRFHHWVQVQSVVIPGNKGEQT